jgi:hypothetical protein
MALLLSRRCSILYAQNYVRRPETHSFKLLPAAESLVSRTLGWLKPTDLRVMGSSPTPPPYLSSDVG